MRGHHLLAMGLDRLSHGRDFRFEQCIQGGFLILGQRRTGFRQCIAQANQSVWRRRSGYGTAGCGSPCTAGARWSARGEQAGGVAERPEIHVLCIKCRANQNTANDAQYDFHETLPQRLELLVECEIDGPAASKTRGLAKKR